MWREGAGSCQKVDEDGMEHHKKMTTASLETHSVLEKLYRLGSGWLKTCMVPPYFNQLWGKCVCGEGEGVAVYSELLNSSWTCFVEWCILNYLEHSLLIC